MGLLGIAGGLASGLAGAAGGLLSGVGGLASGASGLITGLGGTVPTKMQMLGMGVDILGQRQAGAASVAELESARAIANYNAAVQEQEARALKQKAAFEQKRHAKRAERVKGALTAGIAYAGGLGSPVAMDLAAEQAAELELENLLIGYEGEIEAGRSLVKATLDRFQGEIYRTKAKAAKRATRFGIGTTLLKGFGGAFA